MKDVAELAGVSATTVSYVISGRSNRRSGVPEPTRSKVLAAAEQVGYRRNRSARALRKDRTELIALVWHGVMDAWIDATSAQVEELAELRDYGVIHLPYRHPASRRRVVNLLQSGMVDGAIVLGAQYLEARVLRELAAGGLSLVVHSETLRPHGFDVVRHDERAAMATAVDYLVEHGHRRIRLLVRNRQFKALAPRLAGATEALARHNLHSEPVIAGERREEMYATALDLLKTDRPDAILSMTDRGAVASIWAAYRLGVEVPDELSVIGVGNSEEGAEIDPPLTSIGEANPSAVSSVDRLFARIDDPSQPGRTIVRPWQVIVRSSTAKRDAPEKPTRP